MAAQEVKLENSHSPMQCMILNILIKELKCLITILKFNLSNRMNQGLKWVKLVKLRLKHR
jgi:hypothetical protein